MRFMLIIGVPDERFGPLGDDHLHSFHATERGALFELEASDIRWGRRGFHDIIEIESVEGCCPRCGRPIVGLYGVDGSRSAPPCTS